MCSPALIWQELESPSSAPQRQSCSTSQRQQRAHGRTRATAQRSGEQRLAGRRQLGGPGRFFPPDHTVPYSPLLRNPLCYEPSSPQSGRNPAFQFTSSSPLAAPGKPSPQSPERVCLAQGHTARGGVEEPTCQRSRPLRGGDSVRGIEASEKLGFGRPGGHEGGARPSMAVGGGWLARCLRSGEGAPSPVHVLSGLQAAAPLAGVFGLALVAAHGPGWGRQKTSRWRGASGGRQGPTPSTRQMGKLRS